MAISLLVADWMDVGLLPPCVVSAYLVFMCWQALTSSPRDTCRQTDSGETAPASDNAGRVVANALIASFAITWTSWRSSSATSSMFARDSELKRRQPATSKPFAGVVVLDVIDPVAAAFTAAAASTGGNADSHTDASRIRRETPQFHCMMLLAGVYMAMVLTDWDSADGCVSLRCVCNSPSGTAAHGLFLNPISGVRAPNGTSMWSRSSRSG